jgi:hypothetical protein
MNSNALAFGIIGVFAGIFLQYKYPKTMNSVSGLFGTPAQTNPSCTVADLLANSLDELTAYVNEQIAQ